MVARAQSQPDHVQENVQKCSKNGPTVVYNTLANVVNNQYSCRFVYNQSVSDLNILKQEMSATRATWRKWLAASDSCKPVIPGKSYAEVLKTDSQLKGMQNHAENGVATWQGRPLGKLAGWGYLAPTKKLTISSDSPVHKNTASVVTQVALDQLQTPIPVSNRFSPLYAIDVSSDICVHDTLNYTDCELSDLEGDLGILELNTENTVNANNYDDFDKLLLKKKVNQNLVHQARSCSKFVACKQQMDNAFGVIPLSPLMLYEGPKTNYTATSDILALHKAVKNSNCPNYMGIRVPVSSKLNIKNWKYYLADYWDKQLVDLLEFGFPLDFDRNCELHSTEENHASGRDYTYDIECYIQEELKHGAMLGPFDQKPIPLHISPFMTREKPDSEVRRTIVDLSWLKNLSVNAGVVKDKYLGSSFILNYPSVDDIVKKVPQLGPGSLLYKVDISRAFRQLKVDPGDLDLLGLKHQSYFIDQSVPFGYRHGSVFFGKVTDSIRYIMRQQGFPHLYNYVDDLIYCGLPSNIHQSFETLLQLLTQLGLTINPKK